MTKILEDAGDVEAIEGTVVIDGKGHPIAAYTPDAASSMADRLHAAARAARKAASTSGPTDDA